MNTSQHLSLASVFLLTLFSGTGVAATISADQLAAQKAVAKVIKDPEHARFTDFTLAGPRGACMTVFKKNWQSLGTHEAFLLRKGDGWEALYVADVPGGHQGCVDEMSKR
jgi:hypothetical protein